MGAALKKQKAQKKKGDFGSRARVTKGQCYAKIKAEIKVMLLEAKEHQRSPADYHMPEGEARKKSSLPARRRKHLCLLTDSSDLMASEAVK